MTGTSIDALDVALVRISGRGLSMKAEFLAAHTAPLGDLAPRLRDLAEQKPMTAGQIAALSRDFALLHAAAVHELLATSTAKPDLICVHGQTVFHAPPVSWQLFNAPVLADALKTPVVFDLRAADLARGGQGAPITPIADWVLFSEDGFWAVVVNLGGYCNVTKLPDEDRVVCPPNHGVKSVEASDVCACNQLLDEVARVFLGARFDEDGRVAMTGAVDDQAFQALVALLSRQSKSGRSLGTGDELRQWVSDQRGKSASTVARTACEAIAEVIWSNVKSWCNGPACLIIAGGGVHNAALVGALRARAGCPVTPTDTLGIPCSHREAACFAVLGALCQDRVPITLPQVTGVAEPAPISGVWAIP